MTKSRESNNRESIFRIICIYYGISTLYVCLDKRTKRFYFRIFCCWGNSQKCKMNNKKLSQFTLGRSTNTVWSMAGDTFTEHGLRIEWQTNGYGWKRKVKATTTLLLKIFTWFPFQLNSMPRWHVYSLFSTFFLKHLIYAANAAQRIQMTLEKYDEIEKNECRMHKHIHNCSA